MAGHGETLKIEWSSEIDKSFSNPTVVVFSILTFNKGRSLAMTDSNHEVARILQRVRDGDRQSLALLFSKHRDRLWNMVNIRIDRRLRGRVDPDDVLQEAYLDAADRVDQFIVDHSGSFFVWLRLIVNQTLVNVHRRHLGAKMRDAKRDISIHAGQHQQAASTSLALQLLGHLTTPSQAAVREETARKLEEVIEGLEPIDREVLVLRHFEQLTNSEVAETLEIQQKAASIRYIRALKRLREKLSEVPGMATEWLS